MKLQGWCRGCHKIKLVEVRGADLATLARGVPVGVCDQCREEGKT